MNQFYRVVNGFLEEFIFTLSQNRKFISRHLLILLPATIYLGMICFIGKGSPAESFIKSFQVFSFLLAGIAHLYLVNKKIKADRFRFLSESIVYTLFAAGIICITLLFFYLFTDNSMAVMAFNSGAAFALPHVCWQLMDVYKHIPRREHPLWMQPLTMDYSNEVLIPEIVSIQFLIRTERKYMKEQAFIKSVPEGRKLGKAFYSLIEDNAGNKNSELSYSDESGSLYAWEFHIKTMMGLSQRRLDPELSLYNNRVGHTPKVYVKRISTSAKTAVTHLVHYKTISDSTPVYKTLDKQVLKLYSDNHKN